MPAGTDAPPAAEEDREAHHHQGDGDPCPRAPLEQLGGRARRFRVQRQQDPGEQVERNHDRQDQAGDHDDQPRRTSIPAVARSDAAHDATQHLALAAARQRAVPPAGAEGLAVRSGAGWRGAGRARRWRVPTDTAGGGRAALRGRPGAALRAGPLGRRRALSAAGSAWPPAAGAGARSPPAGPGLSAADGASPGGGSGSTACMVPRSSSMT